MFKVLLQPLPDRWCYLFSVLFFISFLLFLLITPRQDARTGTLESAKAMSRTSKLSTLEAMQILNLQKGEMKPDLIKKVCLRAAPPSSCSSHHVLYVVVLFLSCSFPCMGGVCRLHPLHCHRHPTVERS